MDSVPNLLPRNGDTLQVITVSRISTTRQDERRLEDQTRRCKEYVESLFSGSISYEEIETRGSGERLDRKELIRLTELIESRKFDLLICEETSRIARRSQVTGYIEDCEDYGMRFIAINDRLDTSASSDWRVIMGVSAIRHELSNRDTSDRIRRSLRSRFQNGGSFYGIPTGYIRDKGKTHESDVRKDPAYETIIDEIFSRVERGQSFFEIAHWLNEIKAPRQGRTHHWTGYNVRILIFNPLLKGERVLNRTRNQRINKTGRRKRVRTEESEQLFRPCPHLAFIDAERYDRVIALLREKYKHFYFPNGKPGNQDFTKRTIFPGQCVNCGVCGRKMVYCLSKKTPQLVCYGSKIYECWNGILLNSAITREKVLAEVLRVVEKFSGFPEALMAACEAELLASSQAELEKKAKVEQEIQEVDKKLSKIMNFLEESDDPDVLSQLGDRIKTLRQQKESLNQELSDLQKKKKPQFVMPTWPQIRQMIHDHLSQWATESMDFTRVLRKIVPKIVAIPVELADQEGNIEFRGRLTINLAGLFGDSIPESFRNAATQEVEIDLFHPPQRETYRKQVVAMFRKGIIIKNISRELSIATAMVDRSLKLQRCMDRLGIDDAYIRVHMIPERQLGKMRRTLHRSYRFQPLQGFPVE